MPQTSRTDGHVDLSVIQRDPVAPLRFAPGSALRSLRSAPVLYLLAHVSVDSSHFLCKAAYPYLLPCPLSFPPPPLPFTILREMAPLIIVNNTAAKARRAWPKVRGLLESAGVAYESYKTTAPGDA